MANDTNPFGDVTKMFEQLKMPGVDMAAIVEARREDVEALCEANKSAYEAMQAMARKQAEMLTETMQMIQQAGASALGGGANPADQTQVVRTAFEKTVADMKELAEMARSAQAEAIANMTARATAHMEEIRKLTQPK